MTSHLKGPNQGDWSVFAEKVVAERDDLRTRLAEADAARDAALKAREEAMRYLDTEERRAHRLGELADSEKAVRAAAEAREQAALKDVAALKEVLGKVDPQRQVWLIEPIRAVLASPNPGAEYVPASRLREVAERAREAVRAVDRHYRFEMEQVGVSPEDLDPCDVESLLDALVAGVRP